MVKHPNPTNRSGRLLACLISLLCALAGPSHAASPAHGKYGCVSSKYNAMSGSYEFTPRGSFTLSSGGEYSYLGFDKPSKGKFSFDQGSGKIAFSGGYLDKGEAVPIKGETNRFHLTTPTLPGNRWTCGLK